MGKSLKTSLRPPGLIQQILWEAIWVAVGGLSPKKTLARLFITIVIKKATMQPNAPSYSKQKTSIDLSDLCLSEWG